MSGIALAFEAGVDVAGVPGPEHAEHRIEVAGVDAAGIGLAVDADIETDTCDGWNMGAELEVQRGGICGVDEMGTFEQGLGFAFCAGDPNRQDTKFTLPDRKGFVAVVLVLGCGKLERLPADENGEMNDKRI